MPGIGFTDGQDNPLIMGGGSGVTIAITAPAAAEVLTSHVIDFTYTAVPILVAYRLMIWETAVNYAVEPAFDSKVRVGDTIRLHSALETGKSYVARLHGVAISGDRNYADVSFSTNFSDAEAPATLLATPVGMIGAQDTHVLPRVILRWTPSSTVNYLILKSDNGGAFYPIAQMGTDESIYEDAVVCSGHTYKYRVGYNSYTETVEIPVEFEHAFIHSIRNVYANTAATSITDGSPGDFVRFESWEHTQDFTTDMATILPLGRRVPVARFSEKIARSYSLRGLPQQRKNRDLFEKLKALIREQVEEGSTLCLRLGRDREMVFGAVGSATLSATQATSVAGLDFEETFWLEELDRIQTASGGYQNTYSRYEF